MPTLEEKRAQLLDQLRVVEHLGRTIADVHANLVRMKYGSQQDEVFVDMVGGWSADRMELLGDILNDMDATAEDDAWTDPVFDKAHDFWPREPGGAS